MRLSRDRIGVAELGVDFAGASRPERPENCVAGFAAMWVAAGRACVVDSSRNFEKRLSFALASPNEPVSETLLLGVIVG